MRDRFPGGAASEEMLGPGYVVDSCSSGHTLIQTNALLVDDELGLQSDYGLEYIEPDPFSILSFPDGESLTMWLDRDHSHSELSRFSTRDADTYVRMMEEYDAVKQIFGANRFTPPGYGPSMNELLSAHPDGRKWKRRRMMSAFDVICHEFETEHARSFMLWQAFQTMAPVDQAGSGPLAYSVVFGRQRRGWTIPRGGSGQLTDALVRCIEDNNGTVLCGRQVVRLIIENGRCVGFEDADGEHFLGRRGVVSTIHVKQMIKWHRQLPGAMTVYTPSIPTSSACQDA